MRKIVLTTSIALLSMAAAPAPTKLASNQPQPNERAQSAEAPTAQAPAADDKKTCKALPSSGTRFTTKACLTAKEWKQVEAEAENDNGF